jgi:hypothetical protein
LECGFFSRQGKVTVEQEGFALPNGTDEGCWGRTFLRCGYIGISSSVEGDEFGMGDDEPSPPCSSKYRSKTVFKSDEREANVYSLGFSFPHNVVDAPIACLHSCLQR